MPKPVLLTRRSKQCDESHVVEIVVDGIVIHTQVFQPRVDPMRARSEALQQASAMIPHLALGLIEEGSKKRAEALHLLRSQPHRPLTRIWEAQDLLNQARRLKDRADTLLCAQLEMRTSPVE